MSHERGDIAVALVLTAGRDLAGLDACVLADANNRRLLPVHQAPFVGMPGCPVGN